jgi:predicted nicotinamide N-methyase
MVLMDFDAFIRDRLPLEAVPGVPEIRLHRAGPRSGLMRLAEADPDFGSPYWARPWGGGLATGAACRLDHPEVLSPASGCWILARARAWWLSPP